MPSSANGTGRARLADIAKQAGVSEATVSRVLNDRPGVSANARQLVLTALDVLGFERPERLRKRSAGPRRTGHPRTGEPYLPLLRPDDRDGLVPTWLHSRAVHPDTWWHHRGRIYRDAA